MTSERRLLWWVGGFVVLIVLIWLFSAILLPFVMGAAIAYLLDPVADLLERCHLPRWIAALLLTIGFMALCLLAVVLIVPLLQGQFTGLFNRLPDYIESLQWQILHLQERLRTDLPPAQAQELRDAAAGLAGNTLKWFGGLISGLWAGGLALVNLLSLLVITPIVAFYLLRDWDVIIARIDSWLPRDEAPTVRAQALEIDRTLAGFVRGQLTVCLLLGTYYAVGLTAVGLDFGLIVGLLSGFLAFIPYVGTIVGLVASVGLAFAQFSDWTPIILVAAIYLTGQVAEGNFITPKLVGDRVGLHPVWVIFALLAGGALFGFLGVVLAIPAAATIGVLVRFAVTRYLAGPLYTGGGPGEK